MKQLTLTLLTSIALSTAGFGGQMVSESKQYKEYKQPDVEIGCFADRELSIDIFGAYADGNGGSHAGPIREHGWGGGVGINYFFTRNIGIGVEGYWLAAHENAAVSHDDDSDDNGRTTFHNVTGSVIFRFPIDDSCLAPYLFLGGGFSVDGDQWASAHGGLGIEYRIVPNRIGIFTDARFTYFGDRYGNGDQNYVLARAGVRFVF